MADLIFEARNLTDLADHFEKLKKQALEDHKIALNRGRARHSLLASYMARANAFGEAADLIKNLKLGSNNHG